MARDGSGDYSRVEGPYVNGQVADADEINNELDDVATALSDSINRAGTKAFAANQSMGGNKLTNVGTPTAGGDAVNKTYADGLTSIYQPLDATLTALAALSWSSGSPLVSFTAADTVSLTLAPSVSSVTASQGAAATTATGRFTNTTDSASVRALIIEGDRATPANNDNVYASFYLSDSAGNQDEMARIRILATSVTSTSESARLDFYVMTAGTLTNYLILQSGALLPNTNDGTALGTAAIGFSDLFLASGGVINWANGLVTLTHDATLDGLVLGGGGLQAGMALSTETTGTLTSVSANKYIVATGGVTLPNSVFSGGQWQKILAGASSRTITRGSGVTMYVNGVDSATATLASRGTMNVFWESASVCYLEGDVS